MSDLLMHQMAELINKVASDVRRMGDITTEQSQQLVVAMDDLAAALMALQAVTAVQLKANPVDPEAVEAWITENMDPNGEGTDKTRSIARNMLGSA